jgi:hypothetical protein
MRTKFREKLEIMEVSSTWDQQIGVPKLEYLLTKADTGAPFEL